MKRTAITLGLLLIGSGAAVAQTPAEHSEFCEESEVEKNDRGQDRERARSDGTFEEFQTATGLPVVFRK